MKNLLATKVIPFALLALLAGASLSKTLASEVNAQSGTVMVTIRLVDQNDVLIPNAKFSIGPYSGLYHDTAVELAPGTYGVTLFASPRSHRVEYGVVVTETTSLLEFEWITQPVTLWLLDQDQVPIPGANFAIAPFIDSATQYVSNGETVVLPVNDFAVYPTMGGMDKFGKEFPINVGPNLSRTVSDLIVGNAPVVQTYEWILQEVQLVLNDQDGAPISGFFGPLSTLRDVAPIVPSGGTVRIPVNDLTVYPTLKGPDSFGYRIRVSPVSGLYRTEPGVVISPSTFIQVVEMEWLKVEGPLVVVDGLESTVPGSSWTNLSTGGSGNSGTSATLYVTDNTVYPTIGGNMANGVWYRVTPNTTTGHGDFQFEVLPGGALAPTFFQIAGQAYGLRFQLNQIPLADAGANRTIQSSDQGATILEGWGHDLNGDPLIYRWVLNGSPLHEWFLIMLDGRAELALADIAFLGVGSHPFVLEVSDGQSIASDGMVLTIGNSPPDVVTSGTIHVGLGDPVVLAGSVADYDGDLLTFEWTDSVSILGGGLALPPAGGAPVDLPALTISEGFSLGDHLVTVEVSDGVNPPVRASQLIHVSDVTVPTLAPVASPAILWPPNHEMRSVAIALNASDDSGFPLSFGVEVTSNENADKDGDGSTVPDVSNLWIDLNTAILYVDLRAERSGKGSGRVYTVSITATDTSGNSSTAEVKILCPHSKM